MKDDKKAPLDGRGPGVEPITEPDSSLAGDMGATGKLEELVGALQGDEPEITAPGISPDKKKKYRNNGLNII
ncbi:hypothetical protein NSQ29_20125 [Paenibacillus sp. FSL F4-0236]|uniref:hypothetical protein n=1 Tax=Paenibacillus sp. FSL F4-0236 TaxID=2954731 RepID=UPI0030FC1047